MHPAALPDEDLYAQCDVGRGRSGGPGGQHRNKVETKVTLLHRGTGVTAHASERRSAVENRRVALRRLRLSLAVEHRDAVPLGDARSELWRSRVSGGRISCNPRHRDFPALLAEAMDMVWACNLDPKKAAIRLECTPSQLIKLLKDHPAALDALNRARAGRNEHPLK